MGYDGAYLLSDRRLGGSDTYATGLAIATMLKHLGYTKESKEPFVIVAGDRQVMEIPPMSLLKWLKI